MPETRFTLRYATGIPRDLAAIDRKYHGLIRCTIDEQLTTEPTRETRNRKPLKRPTVSGATWELRLGPNNRFRALYNVDAGIHEVNILAIGVKQGNRLLVGEREYGHEDSDHSRS